MAGPFPLQSPHNLASTLGLSAFFFLTDRDGSLNQHGWCREKGNGPQTGLLVSRRAAPPTQARGLPPPVQLEFKWGSFIFFPFLFFNKPLSPTLSQPILIRILTDGERAARRRGNWPRVHREDLAIPALCLNRCPTSETLADLEVKRKRTTTTERVMTALCYFPGPTTYYLLTRGWLWWTLSSAEVTSDPWNLLCVPARGKWSPSTREMLRAWVWGPPPEQEGLCVPTQLTTQPRHAVSEGEALPTGRASCPDASQVWEETGASRPSNPRIFATLLTGTQCGRLSSRDGELFWAHIGSWDIWCSEMTIQIHWSEHYPLRAHKLHNGWIWSNVSTLVHKQGVRRALKSSDAWVPHCPHFIGWGAAWAWGGLNAPPLTLVSSQGWGPLEKPCSEKEFTIQ